MVPLDFICSLKINGLHYRPFCIIFSFLSYDNNTVITNNDGEGEAELFQNNAVVELVGIVCKYKDNKIYLVDNKILLLMEKTVVLS